MMRYSDCTLRPSLQGRARGRRLVRERVWLHTLYAILNIINSLVVQHYMTLYNTRYCHVLLRVGYSLRVSYGHVISFFLRVTVLLLSAAQLRSLLVSYELGLG